MLFVAFKTYLLLFEDIICQYLRATVLLPVKVLFFCPGLGKEDRGEHGAEETVGTTALRKRRKMRRKRTMHFGAALR